MPAPYINLIRRILGAILALVAVLIWIWVFGLGGPGNVKDGFAATMMGAMFLLAGLPLALWIDD